MSLAITKLMLAHMFVSSRRIARHILKDEREAENIEHLAAHELKTLIPALMQEGSQENLLEAVQSFEQMAEEYYKKAVFGTERNLITYLLRDYNSFDKVADALNKELTKHFEKNPEYAGKLRSILEKAKVEEEQLSDAMRKCFQIVRDQKHERERLRDKNLFTLRTDFNLRHSLKEMRQMSGDERALSNEDEHLADEIEKELEKHEAGKETPKLEKLIDKLEEKMISEEKLLEEMFKDALFVIRYAVSKFFAFDEIQGIAEQYIEQHKSYVDPKYLNQINQEFKKLESFKDDQEQENFKIFRKIKKYAKHEIVDISA